MNNTEQPVYFEYNMYNKISDDLCYLGNNSTVKFNISLSHMNKDNNRTCFHSEYMYNTNGENLITIKRKFQYFISIEIFNEEYNKEYVIIGINDILKLRMGLSKVYEWFNDKQYDNLFGKKNGKLIMLKRVEPIIIDDLPQNKSIIFEPTIIEYSDTENSLGVRICICNDNFSTEINLNNLLGFMYQINSINMYECALSMLNYIQRPKFGHNITDFTTQYDNSNMNRNSYVPLNNPIKGRTIKGGDMK